MKKQHHPIIITLIVILAIIAVVLILISFNSNNKPIEPSIINLQNSHTLSDDINSATPKTNLITTASINTDDLSNTQRKPNIYVSLFVSVIVILVIVSVLLLIIRRK